MQALIPHRTPTHQRHVGKNHLRGIDHAEGAEVAVGEGEGGHDEDVGDVRLQEDWGEHPPLRQHVADQEQRDEADPVHSGPHPRLKALTDHLGGGGGVKGRLIRSLLINWRLGNFFSSHFKWISSQNQHKVALTSQSDFKSY